MVARQAEGGQRRRTPRRPVYHIDLAHSLHAQELDTALFLRAERRPDGQRTFKLVEGEPLPTSYGEDSYRRVFGVSGIGRGRRDGPPTSTKRWNPLRSR